MALCYIVYVERLQKWWYDNDPEKYGQDIYHYPTRAEAEDKVKDIVGNKKIVLDRKYRLSSKEIVHVSEMDYPDYFHKAPSNVHIKSHSDHTEYFFQKGKVGVHFTLGAINDLIIYWGGENPFKQGWIPIHERDDVDRMHEWFNHVTGYSVDEIESSVHVTREEIR